MTTIPVTNIILADGDYVPSKGYLPGRSIAVEVSGTFGGATIQLGYASSDVIPVFGGDTLATDGFYTVAKTAPGRWKSVRPASGLPAFRVTGATGTTAILVKIVDLYSR